jgi:hypothetical protein
MLGLLPDGQFNLSVSLSDDVHRMIDTRTGMNATAT